MAGPASRRSLLAGLIAAPALALPAVPAAALSLDAPLMALAAALERACAVERDAERRYAATSAAVEVVLLERPADLVALPWERELLAGSMGFTHLRNVRLRWTPARDDVDEFCCSIWTGAALRVAIANAVPALGQGGTTPHRIQRWKGLLPVADAFDARVAAIEERVGHPRARADRRAAEKELVAIREAIAGSVAHTPEGLAVLIRLAAEGPWKDAGGAWPNLLRSAANVAGVDPADLDHPYATTRGNA